MDKYDTSQLTEFPRFEEEASQSGVSTFFNKLWRFPIFSASETAENLQNKTLADDKQKASQPEDQNKREDDDIKTETASYAVEFEGRSLPNVLKRISSLVALGSGGGTKYADTELARYWMPDDISRECYECASRFSALRRRHHCRVCGQIFCSRCCSQRVPGQIFGCSGGLRVCTYCCNVVLSYLKERDVTGDMGTDLRTLQESLQVKFPANKPQPATRDNFMFAREQDERCDARPAHREELHDIAKQLTYSLPTQPHRYRLVRYNGVWRGDDVIQWVMDNTSNKTRAQASLVCQSLCTAGYMDCVSEIPHFADYALYRPVVLPERRTEHEDTPEECKRMVESVSSYCLDLNLGDSSARLIKATKQETKSTPSSEDDNPVLDNSEGYTESRNICKSLLESGESHLRLLMRQCLSRAGLSAAWLDVLYPLCRQAAEGIVTDVNSSDMDVRNYVQVKKVCGDSARDSCLVHGVVIAKNVAHRGMPQQISNPTVLLLDCSIAYQRVEGKLTSLEPVLMQEQEYLVRCAARIAKLRPRVVLVRGSAARTVQDALRKEGVALACGVRERALRRAARCARAEIVTSIDARIGMPRLGTCRNFYVKTYSNKTLMVLEGCAEPNLGCCIILRGASLQELIRVKKVTKFMLLACYNWKLEKAFLGDIEAILPEPGTFDDDNDVFNDKNDNSNDDFFNDNAGTKLDPNDDVDKTEVKTDDSNNDNLMSSDILNNDATLKDDTKNLDIKDHNTRVDDTNIHDTKDQTKVDDTNIHVTKDQTKVDDTNIHDTKDQTKVDTNILDTKDQTKIDDTNIHVTKDQTKIDDTNIDATKRIDDSSNDIEDPLQRAKAHSDKNLSCGVPIRDFSDPLQSTLSVDDDVFLPKVEEKLQADDTHGDRWSTDDAVLSISPNVVVPPPYLETVAGRRCPLRAHLPPLPRPATAPHTPRARRKLSAPQHAQPEREVHPFVEQPITTTAEDPILRASLAHYRATGCRLVNSNHTRGCPLYKPSVVKQIPKDPEAEAEKPSENEPLDPLAPENHQRISLLLYSYSNKSSNVPDFCVNPWIATMDVYGKHDISLGAFLDKYCFNGDHKCSSNGCQVPLNQHVRKFVHDDACITITCNTVGHSATDKLTDEQNTQVMFWSRCESCGAVGRCVRLSRAALSLSLAQYVRLRAAAPPPRSRRRLARDATCAHPLHAHAHAFVRRLTTACFRFSKISTFDIELPPAVIATRYDTKQMRAALIQHLNELMLKGHETFDGVCDEEAEAEYQVFRQHAEHIHLALTAAHSMEQPTLADVVRRLWSVSDQIITGERMLRDAHDRWATPAKQNKTQQEQSEEKSDLEDSSGEPGNTDSSDPTYGEGTEEDEERGDKKTVRQILSQLLTNNQPANQLGMIISSGLVPVVVMAGEIGSVIAATLASVTYQRSLRAHTDSIQSEHEEAESSSSSKDRVETDKPKPARPNDHIEVLLKDGLLCRVYYAPQFRQLRHMLLAPLGSNPHLAGHSPGHTQRAHGEYKCCEETKDKSENKSLCEIEEGFLRSLAYCVPWAAKGGKSGSTFCKTKDDRYVLKEMTKPEWQQFLEFAPHYFNYVTSCHQQKLPSLLARILGVYSVGGAGNGVLVMENIWYCSAPAAKRFDLKGSSRHRLTADTQPLAVLMDENLLNLRWHTPLFVPSHAGSALWTAVERDTRFLAANSVMDYSLLLAIGRGTLALGLIDYIRTFTWDKKLEHLVKKNLGSGQPTVVSPEQYRARFFTACRKYFLQCPAHWDQWYHAGDKDA